MPKTGILIANTGTPDAPTEDAIRDFLGEMLSDPVLISAPPAIWKRVLKYFILPNRPKRTVGLYQRMWDEGGSKFMRVSRAQRDALRAALSRRGYSGGDFHVELAMRYGNPSIEAGLAHLRELACERVVAVPLYPQYVRVCAGTCLGEVERCLREAAADGWEPDLIEVRHFYDQPAYKKALAESVAARWSYGPGSKLAVSLHSTLMADIEAGDPYHDENLEISRDLAVALGVPEEDWQLSYQSRFDSRKWLQPFTVDKLREWGRDGITDVCIVTPGFVAENIESAVETGETLRDIYLDAAPGGSRYTYVPTLDDAPGLIEAIASAIADASGETPA